jgi:MarR family transcriptional regulator, lower aerobic nicotinate degradation pathway regulator
VAESADRGTPIHADESVRATLDAVRRIVRALRSGARRSETATGLTSAELFIVHALGTGPARSLNELAERTFTDQSSASPVVERLRQRGLVRRERSAEDGRRVVIALTPAGRAALANAPEAPQEAIIDAISRLSPTDRRALARTLTRLVAEMGLAGERPAMLFEEPPADEPPPGAATRPTASRRGAGRRR